MELGLGRRSDPSLRKVLLKPSDLSARLAFQQPRKAGELQERSTREVLQEPLRLCGVRRRPPLLLTESGCRAGWRRRTVDSLIRGITLSSLSRADGSTKTVGVAH